MRKVFLKWNEGTTKTLNKGHDIIWFFFFSFSWITIIETPRTTNTNTLSKDLILSFYNNMRLHKTQGLFITFLSLVYSGWTINTLFSNNASWKNINTKFDKIYFEQLLWPAMANVPAFPLFDFKTSISDCGLRILNPVLNSWHISKEREDKKYIFIKFLFHTLPIHYIIFTHSQAGGILNSTLKI